MILLPSQYYGIDEGGGAAAAPIFPDQVLGYAYTYDAHGAIEGDVTVNFAMIAGPGDEAFSYPQAYFSATSDGDGYLAIIFVKGATYEANRDGDIPVEFLVPDTGPFELPEIL